MPALLPVLAAILGSLLTALVQIYIGRRAKAGTVATSEAAEVWAAQKNLTGELRVELTRLQTLYRSQLEETDGVREETSSLRVELAKVREAAEIASNTLELVRTEGQTMRIRMMDLERQLEDCRKWLKETTQKDQDAN